MDDSIMEELFDTLKAVLPAHASVLDIGVNNGALSLRFLEELNLAYLKGIEAASGPTYDDPIKIDNPNIELIYNQPIQTFQDDTKYDMVVMFKVLHYTAFPVPREALQIVKRFLKDDGLILLGLALNPTTSEGDRRKIDLQQMRSILESAGLFKVYDKAVDPYDFDYAYTHILLYKSN